MTADEVNRKIQNILRGEYPEGGADSCETICRVLCKSFGASPTLKTEFESRARLKERQAIFLRQFALENELWFEALPQNIYYLTAGGESTVYFKEDGKVIKLNGGVYYATWLEYFTSLALHNVFFPNTAYSLAGFTEVQGVFSAMVQQHFVKGEQALLADIEEFLSFNGFVKTRRQDYYNTQFKIALEDMHDENVIAKEGSLFFIDTVFYILP